MVVARSNHSIIAQSFNGQNPGQLGIGVNFLPNLVGCMATLFPLLLLLSPSLLSFPLPCPPLPSFPFLYAHPHPLLTGVRVSLSPRIFDFTDAHR